MRIHSPLIQTAHQLDGGRDRNDACTSTARTIDFTAATRSPSAPSASRIIVVFRIGGQVKSR